MKPDNKFYLYKEDVWQHGQHGMTSASRDIFEHFYKSIKSTFLNQFNNPEINELVEYIYYIRNWESSVFAAFSNAAEKKSLDVLFLPYTKKRAPMPEEKEWQENQLVPKEQMLFDSKIYKNFESFFKEADHGFSKSDNAKDDVYKLWEMFIQDFNKEDLETQFKEELISALEWEVRLRRTLNNYINSNTTLSWHQFLSKSLHSD